MAMNLLSFAFIIKDIVKHSTPSLLEEIRIARIDGTYTNLLKKYSRFNLLVLDDFGIAQLHDDDATNLFEIIEDRTEMFWSVDEAAKANKFAETMEKFESDGDYYEDEIYTQRFYSKHVYRGADLTMVFVNTHTDGNRFFAIYDNTKEVK